MRPTHDPAAPCGDAPDPWPGFAPGLLALRQRPPPRLSRAVLHGVAALLGVLLVWAFFGRLDVVASAEGRLVPRGYVKIVQPAEGGIVRHILVREGQPVEAGQALMRMDTTLAEADERAVRHELALQGLQLRRIDAELAGHALAPAPDDPPSLFAQVAAQHRARRQAYLDAMAQEQAVLDKTRHELRAAGETLHTWQQTLPMVRRSVAAFEKLGRQGFHGAIAVEDKRRELIEKEQALRAQDAVVDSLRAQLIASERRRAQITSDYRRALQNERIATASRLARLREDLHRIEHTASLLTLRAPQRGIVKDLATHTAGTVVAPGTVLMTLVPRDEPLLAQVFIRNEDIGFVREHQPVKVKLAAYPFQKYGLLEGRVIHVGADAADPGAQPHAPGPPTGDAPRYKALVRLATQHLAIDGQPLGLAPGMQLVADIHLGQRTVLEYLLSPLRKGWREAGRER